MKKILEEYLKNICDTTNRGDAREESYYKHLDRLIKEYTGIANIKNIDITILPKKTESGNPDFRICDGKTHITGYIEAKAPSVTNLDHIENTEQIKRYLSTFPNFILTNFYEFRLYRDSGEIARSAIGRPFIADRLQKNPPLENTNEFTKLIQLFFSFSLPKINTASLLAVELTKRTRFLRDEVISAELANNQGSKQIIGFFEAFKEYLIGSLNKKQFADIYAQTVTYGMFAARARASGEFNRRAAFDYIPHTIGILRNIFRFISFEEPPLSMQSIVDDIAEVLNAADVDKILHEYESAGKELANLHLLKSPALNPPVAKYQGIGDNNRIEKILYKEKRIYINADKYFEKILPEVWNYKIGGYQVLKKYLKDRKNRNIENAPHYCRIVTALSKTIEIQKEIDKIYPQAEKQDICF
ncbi:MAG: hypothetical protein JRJ44_00895 [Deltaproteobacteria bacterium]|nr:hypothetical protein [Deltaproteobacteria bacterium]